MKIAVITPNWPCKSEYPILNQIIELKKQDYKDIHFFAFSTSFKDQEQIPEEFYEYDLLENITYLKQPDLSIRTNKLISKSILILRSIPYLIRTLLYSPSILFKSLFKKEYGEYRKAFKIIYLIQNLFGNKFDFDIIHCHYAPIGLWGAILKDLGLINGKLVTTFHGYGINKLPKIKPKNYYDFLIEKSTFFTSNSEFTKNNAIKIGFPENKIFLIRVSLLIDAYYFHQRSYKKTDCFNVITVAALRNVKGLKYAIDAIRIVIENNPQIKILYKIIGEGYLQDTLKDYIKENNLDKYVKLLGFVSHDKLKSYYYYAHVFVLSSTITKTGNQEAQGLVFQEAQACGLPVIGSNTGGISEGILDGKSGFVVQDKRPEQIAEKIMYFHNHPEKIIEFGLEGRKYVEKSFNIEIETQKLIALYNRKNE